jgi:hypothetical protein
VGCLPLTEFVFCVASIAETFEDWHSLLNTYTNQMPELAQSCLSTLECECTCDRFACDLHITIFGEEVPNAIYVLYPEIHSVHWLGGYQFRCKR